jgi:UDP-N-acetylglucosamine transferase subunit ALG13
LKLPLKREILFLVSGPEPQRSIFETKIREEIKRTGCKNYILVKGKPGVIGDSTENETNHLSADELNEVIATTRLVISRSGYTTIMDLCKLGKRAIFIPTPGQTEQEYLAQQLQANGIAFYQSQNKFDLALALTESKKYKGFEGYSASPNLLAEAIDDLLKNPTPNA